MSKIDGLINKAKECGYEALALTDHGNLYGAIEFYKKAKKNNLKPIIGVEMYLAPYKLTDKEKKIDSRSFHLTILAKNNEGYKNLLKLVSIAWLEGFYYKPRIDKETLRQYSQGLICLSGCPSGEIPRLILNNKYEESKKVALFFKTIFNDDFYLEVNYHPNLENAKKLKDGLLRLSKETNIPLVATYDSHYLNHEDNKIHDIFLAIQTGKDIEETERLTMKDDDFSFADKDTINKLYADIPEAMRNTVKIAEQVSLEIELNKPKMPFYPLPDNETADSYLKKLCLSGINKRNITMDDNVKQRLETELKIIEITKFASYFLVVSDIVNFAKNNNLSVGPGRGSVSGSLVAYLLNITDINPLKYGLLFERFLTPDRIEFPDIDIDFSDTKRSQVFNYLKNKYGKDKVAQIITFGKMASRAAVRDAGRALGYSFSVVDKLARLIPANMPLNEAKKLNDVTKLLKNEPFYKQIIETAEKLEGTIRHASVHACGLVITPTTLTDYLPLQFAPNETQTIISQYDMYSVNELGLLKMDILGLKTLSIIEDTKRIIYERKQENVNFNDEFNDKATFDLLKKGYTKGIFQLEGRGMTRYLQQIQPERIEDLVSLIALYRPGPMELIPSYIRRKQGKEKIEYPHPSLEPILKETFGIMVYQEQLMQMAQKLANYSPTEADVLRKAVGKKIKQLLINEINKLKTKMIDNGIDQKTAEQIANLVEPFARYGFNKSHAVAYAIMGYYTAYLKTHYTIEFITACLIHNAKDIDKIKSFLDDCKNYGINILPPSINESNYHFTIINDKTIRFGLGSIKNVGEPLIKFIEQERKNNGPYKNLLDFINRIKFKDLNKKSLESLIKAGAFDDFYPRQLLIANLDYIIDFIQKNKNINHHNSLFGVQNDLSLKETKPIDKLQILQWEKELLGLYISGHPFENFQNIFKHNGVKNINEVRNALEGTKIATAGVLTNLVRKITKAKEPIAYGELEDLNSNIEIVFFPKIYEQYFDKLTEGKIYYIVGTVRQRDNKSVIFVDLAKDITNMRHNNKNVNSQTSVKLQ